MQISKNKIPDETRSRLVAICYNIIGCIHSTYHELSPGLPEPVFQESLLIALHDAGFLGAEREYQHHPIFRGKVLKSSIKADLLVPTDDCKVVIECKAISCLTDKERLQLFGYLRGIECPIGILVNFGSFPKAQIERYYYNTKDNSIVAF